MWTSKTVCSTTGQARYPSDLTDAEWHIRAALRPAKRGGGKRTVDMREVVNGVMYC